jgi:hypothetical protein
MQSSSGNGDFDDERAVRGQEGEAASLPCAACGASVMEGASRGFALGGPNVLCWECAVRRGGRYDARQDRWTVSPDVSDLSRSLVREP